MVELGRLQPKMEIRSCWSMPALGGSRRQGGKATEIQPQEFPNSNWLECTCVRGSERAHGLTSTACHLDSVLMCD